jgi:hypothetical protein
MLRTTSAPLWLWDAVVFAGVALLSWCLFVLFQLREPVGLLPLLAAVGYVGHRGPTRRGRSWIAVPVAAVVLALLLASVAVFDDGRTASLALSLAAYVALGIVPASVVRGRSRREPSSATFATSRTFMRLMALALRGAALLAAFSLLPSATRDRFFPVFIVIGMVSALPLHSPSMPSMKRKATLALAVFGVLAVIHGLALAGLLPEVPALPPAMFVLGVLLGNAELWLGAAHRGLLADRAPAEPRRAREDAELRLALFGLALVAAVLVLATVGTVVAVVTLAATVVFVATLAELIAADASIEGSPTKGNRS